MRRLVIPALCALLLAGCGSSLREGDASGNVQYSVSARQNYDLGMRHLADGDYLESAKYFTFVKARFPYSKYAVLAELRLADTAFGSGAYMTAIDQFKLFIKFHPTHNMVTNGYAAFRIGAAYYHMLPTDWFLTPPRYEKDMTDVTNCVRQFDGFKRKYPHSPFMAKAMKMRTAAAKILAAHEWYVADFYWKRHHPMGTVLRLRDLLKNYPGVGFDERALWRLANAYLQVGRPKDARQTFQRLIKEHPHGRHAPAARSELSRL